VQGGSVSDFQHSTPFVNPPDEPHSVEAPFRSNMQVIAGFVHVEPSVTGDS
jgi:hypothetical protein